MTVSNKRLRELKAQADKNYNEQIQHLAGERAKDAALAVKLKEDHEAAQTANKMR